MSAVAEKVGWHPARGGAMGIERQDLKHRLRAGESLEVSTGGGSFEVWIEPYANPPTLFYEGRPLPYGELDRVIDTLLDAIARGDVQCRWLEARGAQVKSCEEGYRSRTRETTGELP